MSILYVIFLNIMFVSYVRSDVLPGVACVILGTHSGFNRDRSVKIPGVPDRCKAVIEAESNLNEAPSDDDDGVERLLTNNSTQHSTKVKIYQIPDRCKVVIIGQDYFDDYPRLDDADAIGDFKNAGKTVYMIYRCSADRDWVKIISDQTELDKFIEPMLTYIETKKIEGVILGYLNIYEGKISDYATKINTFISKIRNRVNSIKIGLHLDGTDSHHFNNNHAFDFNLTNTTVDFYVVDLWKVGPDCIKDMNQFGGRQPIKSDDPAVLTLYCSQTTQGVWCVDTSQILYERVKFLKNNNFNGLMIHFLDFDDMTNTCGCENYPIANTFIDAWEDIPSSSCPALN